MRHLRLNAISPSYAKLGKFQISPPNMRKPPELAQNTPRFISNIGFFEPMTSEECDFVAERGKIKTWQAGEVILEQGEEGRSMFVILGGLVKAYIIGHNNEEAYVGQIQTGELFGEMSLLTNEPRSATVKSVTPVTTMEITQDIFEHLLTKRPSLGEKLSEIIAIRQRKSADIVTQNSKDETQTLKKSIYGKMSKIFKLL